MPRTPLVSIGIPTFDRPEMLATALRSALEQTYDQLEVVVVDDAGAPDVGETVRKVAAGDPRVRYLRNERNLGNVGNGLRALRELRGDYVKLLLDDDVLTPDHIERLVGPLEDDPTLTLAIGARAAIDAAGSPAIPPADYRSLRPVAGCVDGLDLIEECSTALVNRIGEHSAVLFPRRTLDLTQPFRFAGGEVSGVLSDLAMWFSLLARGDAWYDPAHLSSIRQHEGQVTGRVSTPLDSAADWCVLHQRVHLAGVDIDRATRLRVLSGLIGATAAHLANAPDEHASARAGAALRRTALHLTELCEQGHLAAVPRLVVQAPSADDATRSQLQRWIALGAVELHDTALDPQDAAVSLRIGPDFSFGRGWVVEAFDAAPRDE